VREMLCLFVCVCDVCVCVFVMCVRVDRDRGAGKKGKEISAFVYERV
jgi:hypothetical protein